MFKRISNTKQTKIRISEACKCLSRKNCQGQTKNGRVYFVPRNKPGTNETFFESLRSREKVAPLPRRPIDLLEMESRFAPQRNLSVVASNLIYVGGIGMCYKPIGVA